MRVRLRKSPVLHAERWRGGSRLASWTVIKTLDDLEVLQTTVSSPKYRRFQAAIKMGHGILRIPDPQIIHEGDWLVIGAGQDTGVYNDEAFRAKFTLVG